MTGTDNRKEPLPERLSVAPPIVAIRGLRVLLDEDLAHLYGVETRALVQAVKRNTRRFPEDFMFQLTPEEARDLRSQSVTSSKWGGRRYPPYAFTEQGVAMLSSVLRSEKAVQINILIMRAFVRMREMAVTHSRVAAELEKLRDRVDVHDASISSIMEVLTGLLGVPERETRRIGFGTEQEPQK